MTTSSDPSQPPSSKPTDHATTATTTNTETFTLLLFATAATFTTHSTLTLPAPTTIPQLFNTLESRFPGMKRKVLRSVAVSVNLEYVNFEVDGEGNVAGGVVWEDGGGEGGRVGKERGDGGGQEEVVIRAGDEVGIIPPVSSG